MGRGAFADWWPAAYYPSGLCAICMTESASQRPQAPRCCGRILYAHVWWSAGEQVTKRWSGAPCSLPALLLCLSNAGALWHGRTQQAEKMTWSPQHKPRADHVLSEKLPFILFSPYTSHPVADQNYVVLLVWIDWCEHERDALFADEQTGEIRWGAKRFRAHVMQR